MSSASTYLSARSALDGVSDRIMEPQRRTLILWVPVFWGAGIFLYFGLPFEPPLWSVLLATGLFLALRCLVRNQSLLVGVLIGAVSAASFGVTLAKVRADAVSAPVIKGEFAGTVEGRVLSLSRSASGNPRVLLDQVTLYGAGAQPERIRIALTRGRTAEGLLPGTRVRLFARLSPPARPAEPGGFDFRRMAYFERLGAVGYTDAPILVLGQARTGPSVWLLQLRCALSDAIKASLPGRMGGFATAILTGDRADVDPATLEDLRASNLAHLLAISGLHMGLVSGFVFAAVRFGIAVVPGFALRVQAKKVGAAVALLAACAYLFVSGGAVATQRAFVMVAVVLVAVLLNRPAFTLRAVALAAVLILIWRPESVLGAGFQMSFAATAALVATFEALRGVGWWRDEGRGWVTRLRPVLSLAIASAVAGAATAPLGAYHFNQIAAYGLLANLLAVPLMSALIMPAGVLAAVLWPVGLGGLTLQMMGWGIEWVLAIAAFVASLDGAARPIASAPAHALICVVVGGLWLILWRGPARGMGLLASALGGLLWTSQPRPDVIISHDGRLVGALGEEGRVLNRMRGSGFVASSWLKNDGDPISQREAALRWAGERRRDWALTEIAGAQVTWVWGDGAPDGLCTSGALYIAPRSAEQQDGPCYSLTSDDLDHGPIVAWHSKDGWEIARSRPPHRPWHQ